MKKQEESKKSEKHYDSDIALETEETEEIIEEAIINEIVRFNKLYIGSLNKSVPFAAVDPKTRKWLGKNCVENTQTMCNVIHTLSRKNEFFTIETFKKAFINKKYHSWDKELIRAFDAAMLYKNKDFMTLAETQFGKPETAESETILENAVLLLKKIPMFAQYSFNLRYFDSSKAPIHLTRGDIPTHLYLCGERSFGETNPLETLSAYMNKKYSISLDYKLDYKKDTATIYFYTQEELTALINILEILKLSGSAIPSIPEIQTKPDNFSYKKNLSLFFTATTMEETPSFSIPGLSNDKVL